MSQRIVTGSIHRLQLSLVLQHHHRHLRQSRDHRYQLIPKIGHPQADGMDTLGSTLYDATEGVDDEVEWPLSYRLQLPQRQLLGVPPPKRWWSHTLYRGADNKPVDVLYSKTKSDSEILAQKFLDEPVLGFDMEWPVFPKSKRLQEQIGLIQIACEDKIGLFHIGLHAGTTSEDVLAPSLRKIIESPSIAKTGVAIQNADFSRLIKYFKLKPQAAFELSHLYRLVTFGARKPELITTKLVKLAQQVEEYLGLPLSKGSVRTSNWSRPLNQQQIDYAAADAYAGFMLFHCMNAKRMVMDPIPPLPLLADKYTPFKKGGSVALQLHPLEEGGSITTIAGFYGAKVDRTDAQEPHIESEAVVHQPTATIKAKEKRSRPKKERETLDAFSQGLYNELSLRRKALATKEGVAAYRVASNAVLEGLAQQRPLEDDALLQIRGIGTWQRANYGAEWMQVIAMYLAENGTKDSRPESKIPLAASVSSTNVQVSKLPATPSQRRRFVPLVEIEDSSSPAFGTPPPHTPVLHTGISFTMAKTMVDSEDEECLSDSSASSSVYVTPPSKSTSQLKRKRSESTVRDKAAPMAPAPPEPLTLELKIHRNKLLAFSRLVTTKLNPRPLAPIVTDWTLDRIVTEIPKTKEELKMITGIETFLEACEMAGKDLLAQIHKYAPAS